MVLTGKDGKQSRYAEKKNTRCGRCLALFDVMRGERETAVPEGPPSLWKALEHRGRTEPSQCPSDLRTDCKCRSSRDDGAFTLWFRIHLIFCPKI